MRQRRPSPAECDEIEATLATLEKMNLEQLRGEWRQRYGTEPPMKKSAELIRRFLAWRIQEEVYGGLSTLAKRRLKSLATILTKNPQHVPFVNLQLKPGTQLVREWRGVRHEVRVEDGGFHYAGKRFASLSMIARAITGTQWSGPAFFGLRQRKDDEDE